MSDFEIALYAASFAAALTFLVARLDGFLNRVRTRNVNNYNALVKLEHLANEYGSAINDNRQGLQAIMEVNGSLGVLPLNRLEQVAIQNEIKIDLQDLDLINKIFGIEYSLRRLNGDAAMINNNLDSFQSGVVGGTLTPQQYSPLLASLLVQGRVLDSYMEDFLEDVADMAAHARLRREIDTTVSIRLTGWISRFRKRNITKEELQREKKKVLAEIEQNRKISVEKKAKIEAAAQKE